MNNFDLSSSGVNLDLTCVYDNDLSRMWFENDFEILTYSSYIQNSLLLHTQGGEFSIDGLSATDIDNKGLVRYLINEGHYTDYREFFECESSGYLREYTFDIWCNILDSLQYSDLDKYKLIENYAKTNYTIVSCTGFSQGDYTDIIVLKGSYAFKNNGLDFTNEVYSSPLRITLELDDDFLYLDEGLKDLYKYDKDGILKVLKEQIKGHPKKDYIVNWVADNLPEYPDYI